MAARTILPSVQKMVKMGDTFEKGLMRATLQMSSGYGWSWWVAKHGYSMVAESLAHRAIDVTKGTGATSVDWPRANEPGRHSSSWAR